MALAETNNILIKVFVTSWAILETVLLSGVGYGWASFVFIFKEEGIYSERCIVADPIRTNSSGVSGDQPTDIPGANVSSVDFKEVTSKETFPTCLEQDRLMSLCFTISVFCQCMFSVFIGQVHFKYGTKISRLIAS